MYVCVVCGTCAASAADRYDTGGVRVSGREGDRDGSTSSQVVLASGAVVVLVEGVAGREEECGTLPRVSCEGW